MSEIGIGSTVWIFDQNNREYAKDENGRARGGPIWIKSWVPRKIVGENRASWILEFGDKFPKRNGAYTAGRGGYGGKPVATSWETVKEMEWITVHRRSVEMLVGRCQDPAILRRIAALVGYTEAK